MRSSRIAHTEVDADHKQEDIGADVENELIDLERIEWLGSVRSSLRLVLAAETMVPASSRHR